MKKRGRGEERGSRGDEVRGGEEGEKRRGKERRAAVK